MFGLKLWNNTLNHYCIQVFKDRIVSVKENIGEYGQISENIRESQCLSVNNSMMFSKIKLLVFENQENIREYQCLCVNDSMLYDY